MGSGYRVFTAGEVLTASNVQNYLQDQAVMVFGGTAARSSAIGTANFEEGMLTYLTDVDKLQVYTGAAFADVYPAAASNQGLTLINTTSFSGVTAQTINPFTATYDDYKIVIKITAATAATDLLCQLSSGATPLTTASYDAAYMVKQLGAGAFSSVANTATTFWILSGVANTSTSADYQAYDFSNPFASKYKSFNGSATRQDGYLLD